MQVRAGIAGRGAVYVALLAGVLTGCSEGAPEEPEDKRPSASASADGTVATKGGTIGAKGSSCELPVTFDIAEEWTAETVDVGPAGDVAEELLRQGPVAVTCEIDAKPAGNIGYLRVWTGEPAKGDARAVLQAFVEAQAGASKETYRTFKTGGLDGVEVEYLYTSELLDETKKERALAVVTSDGPVVVHLGGLDTEEHEEMLPAYQLAKRTLRGN
ncbi:lipoprotein [Streptomyces sp. NBC_00457]|uniref:lipoprotein n=1 Tax=unclassified Streptomyces TaxID=2593676 RepID=UPI002E22A447|nr:MULTISPECIES: lipoprotein [unclassified Streptomyces]